MPLVSSTSISTATTPARANGSGSGNGGQRPKHVTRQVRMPVAAAMATVPPLPRSKACAEEPNAGVRAEALTWIDDSASGSTTGEETTTRDAAVVPLKTTDGNPPPRHADGNDELLLGTVYQPASSRMLPYQHSQLLEAMDRKTRELCDDTRRQYESLLQRQDASHERQVQALQHKLKDVISASISLSEHRQALSEMARSHERDTRALIQLHDDETAQLHLKCKQIANDHQLRRSRAFQHEKEELLATITQLEMDRNSALVQWREEELLVLSLRHELDETTQTAQRAETNLQEACQHIVALKAQLSKIDRLATKVKAERVAHAQELAQWQQRMAETSDAKNVLSTRVSVLETEAAHLRSVCETQGIELATVKNALAARDAQAVELQRIVAEVTTRETLFREFREAERAAHDEKRREWRASQERLQTQESDAREQIAALQQAKQQIEAQCHDVTSERKQSEQALIDKLRVMRNKYAHMKQRLQQVETKHAELQDEERVNHLLFASTR